MKLPGPPVTPKSTVRGRGPTSVGKSRYSALGPVKKRYISPLERRVGAVLTTKDLQFFGRCLLKYIRSEAKKDAAKTGQVPITEEFFKSFSYVVKDNTIDVTCSWPWIRLIREGTNGPYRMKWLTQQEGVFRVPLRGENGQVIIRTAPLTTDKAWIHPGIAKHTFIERAFRRAQKDCLSQFIAKNVGKILDGTLT